jgi:hypothetical protein
MRESLEILKHISLQGREENAKLTKVSTQSYKDSRMLKALTIVATMYLPATFLAVCWAYFQWFSTTNIRQTVFSSNLVQTESKPNGETHMVLASQFWIFVAVALPLMLTTFAFTLWLERIWLRHGHVDLWAEFGPIYAMDDHAYILLFQFLVAMQCTAGEIATQLLLYCSSFAPMQHQVHTGSAWHFNLETQLPLHSTLSRNLWSRPLLHVSNLWLPNANE